MALSVGTSMCTSAGTTRVSVRGTEGARGVTYRFPMAIGTADGKDRNTDADRLFTEMNPHSILIAFIFVSF